MHQSNVNITVYLLSADHLDELESANWLGILDQQDRDRIVHAVSKRRIQFLLSRLLLRYALSRHLGDVNPGTLEVIEVRDGQPAVPLAQQRGLHFNISHSHRYVAIAVSEDSDDGVGVDIEYRGRKRPITEIARAFCSERELVEIRSENPPADQTMRLFSLWTRKEAVLKSRGQGLADMPMKEICFQSTPPGSIPGGKPSLRTVSSGVLGDYCLSVATSRPFRLAIRETVYQSAGPSLVTHPRDSSPFVTSYTAP